MVQLLSMTLMVFVLGIMVSFISFMGILRAREMDARARKEREAAEDKLIS